MEAPGSGGCWPCRGDAEYFAPDLQFAAKKIRQLEDELAIVKAASALYDEQSGGAPKRKFAIVDGLVAHGFSARRACRTIALNRSTYIKHRRCELSIRAIRRRIVADYVVMIHGQSGGTYGWGRIRAELLDEYEMIVNR